MDKNQSFPQNSLDRPLVSNVLTLQKYQRPDAPLAPYVVEPLEPAESSTSLGEYWHMLMRHKLWLLAACVGGFILGLLLTIPFTPVFKADTSLEVLNVNEDFMNMRPSQPSLPQGDSDNISEEETQATLLQSQPLLDRVVAQLDPTFPQREMATSGWRSWLHLSKPRALTQRDLLVDGVMQSLKVGNTPRTRVLNVSAESSDPALAKAFLDTLVQEFIAANVKDRWASTQQTSQWLTHELDDAKSKLQASENALQAYAQKAQIFFTDQESQTNVATEKLQQIQQELAGATADRIAKQSDFELARNSPPDALPDVLTDNGLQALRARLDEATQQLASLTALYNPGYPKVKQAEAEVASLRAAYSGQRSNLVAKIQENYNSALQREKLLSREYDQQAREVAGQDERTVQYNMLKREVDSNRQLYDTMLQQMKQASIAVALRASNIRVISPAYVQPKPIFPNPKLNAGLGLVAGLFGAVAFIFLREKSDRTVRHPGELRLWAALPELGSIPRYSALPKARRALLPFGGNGNGSEASHSLPAIPMPVNDAFQATLTSILMSSDGADKGQVLAFTSAEPADGKTSVVSNVAIAAAKIGKRVLLLDADLRRPRVHEIFGLQQEPGLSDLLCADLQNGSTGWRETMQESSIPGLFVLSAGASRGAAVHRFYSSQFASLLRDCRKEFDLVLIDTPPALQISDARIIGRQTDGVVLVARAEQTSREAFTAVRDRFAGDGTRLIGCILNDWDPRRSAHMYPYYSASEPTCA